MYETRYHRPATLADAVALFKAADDGKFIAGGQTLIPAMKQRLAAPSDLIDVTNIDEMQGVCDSQDSIHIGAAVCHADVAANGIVLAAQPALAKLASNIGDPHVRNRGTIGGSIANNDPAADYPAACLALGATIKTTRREVSAADFFTGMFETALEEDEIIISIGFPKVEKAGYAKFANPASRYAMVGVFVARAHDGAARVAVTGAGPEVLRVAALESALSANWTPDALEGLTVSDEGLNSDLHGSAEYRAHLVGVMARRAVAASL